ncbi:chaperonin 10-like protein [Aspergillus novoparasiticus]|uniref:Chaperonin 10-like protein n=1 Tax=Aspergillus novoparasiticus TaxID=986946 RepID=A0A5N6F423_9EURO|nr:chaperonin 10-like protein [Aspergillus novoparasiticus]
MPPNRASWLMAKQALNSIVDVAPYTIPSANELVIKTKAVAVNPADVGIQKLGILLNDYPAILGCDVAGDVVEVHPTLAEVYTPGDRVIGAAGPLKRKDGKYCYSAFQEYVVLKAPSIAKIPNGVAYEDAVVLPLGINTAASCLFAESTLGLEVPSIDGLRSRRGKILLVWGASSSVGACGVQMATHAGYEVVGVASKRNHEMVKGLGASVCFDQSDSTLVDDIVTYLSGKEVVGAYGAIASDSALNAMCEILDRCGGRKLVASVIPGAEQKATKEVQIVTNFTSNIRSSGVGKAIWRWLAIAMAEGWIKYMPQSEVVGEGMQRIQEAIDLLAEGVSAKKLVVSI